MLKRTLFISIVATFALSSGMMWGCGDWTLYDYSSEENGNGNGGDEPTFFDCETGFPGLSGFSSTAKSVDPGYQRPGAVISVPEEMDDIYASNFGIEPGDILMAVRKISSSNERSGIVNTTDPDATGFPIELGQGNTIYGMALQREDISVLGVDYTFNSLIYTYHNGTEAGIHIEPLNYPFTSISITDIQNGNYGISQSYFNTLTSIVVNSTFDKFVLFVVDVDEGNGGRVIRLSIDRDIDISGYSVDLEIDRLVLKDGLVEPTGIALSDDDELLILDWDQTSRGSLYKVVNASNTTAPNPTVFLDIPLIPGGVAFAAASGSGSILVTGQNLSSIDYIYEYDVSTGVFQASLVPLASGHSILQLGPLAYNCSDGSLWVSDRGGEGVNDYTGKILKFQ